MSALQVAVVLVALAAAVLAAAWATRDRRDAGLDDLMLFDPAPLPDTARSWLVVDARVRHDVLGLGTVLDPTPAHAPYAGQVLVRFDALSGPRWIRPRELEPVHPDDERLVRDIVDARPRLLSLNTAAQEQAQTLYPRECVDGIRVCYWHGTGCGTPNPWAPGDRAYCCATCPARGGAR